MPRYIDADALINQIDGAEELKDDADYEIIARYIENMPSADVAEIKHGEWIAASDTDGEYWLCSQCGEELPRIATRPPTIDNPFPELISIDKTPHCPNCGARMDL